MFTVCSTIWRKSGFFTSNGLRVRLSTEHEVCLRRPGLFGQRTPPAHWVVSRPEERCERQLREMGHGELTRPLLRVAVAANSVH
jgi:hypothetical protein